jgi:lipoprotein NlpI
MILRSIFFLLCPFLTLLSETEFNLLPVHELSGIKEKYSASEKSLTSRLLKNPTEVSSYSSRGDARLFLGDFFGARMDYEKMINLNPKLEVSHWRLGIAYFYLSDFSKAARQFEIYHQYDNIDRENGIWRFMSQYKESGLKVARKGLLNYSKDDRPPYPWLYSMFAGDITPEEVFIKIKEENFPEKYALRVQFHAFFYVGIFLELTGENPSRALEYLAQATTNKYGRQTGTYMWHVARLYHSRLLDSIQEKKK